MKTYILFLFAAFTVACGCKNTTQESTSITISPEAGTSYKSGQAVAVKVSYAASYKPDSVVYSIDSQRIAMQKDSSVVNLKTDTLSLGPRTITATLYQAGKSQDISTNIVLTAAKAPEEYTYTVEKIFPHDTSAYTEGLQYQDGYLYESAGNYGHSELRKVELNTGKVVQRTKLDAKYFGEGIAIVGDKIIQLTYKEKVGFVYDKNTFKLLSTFNNNVGVEGWGMCFDGNKLYMDDSTNRIWFLNKSTYQQAGFIDVYDDKSPISQINELEVFDGKIYANVYTTNYIMGIDLKTGAVLQRIDMKDLWPARQHPLDFDEGNNVLNGIAYDAKNNRIFVTGKKWPHIYQVKFVKK